MGYVIFSLLYTGGRHVWQRVFLHGSLRGVRKGSEHWGHWISRMTSRALRWLSADIWLRIGVLEFPMVLDARMMGTGIKSNQSDLDLLYIFKQRRRSCFDCYCLPKRCRRCYLSPGGTSVMLTDNDLDVWM